MNFCIYGIPRSRTAWLSTFFTANGYFCYHEAINGCNSLSEYMVKTATCGDSTTNIAMSKYMPTDTKLVLIHGDIDKSVEYCEAYGLADSRCWLESGSKTLQSLEGLHVDLHDIDSRLEEIWAYVTGDMPYNERVAECIMGLDIKVKEPYAFDRTAFSNLLENLDGRS